MGSIGNSNNAPSSRADTAPITTTTTADDQFVDHTTEFSPPTTEQLNMRCTGVKRLMKEAAELRHANEMFCARPMEDNLFEWHFSVRGPPDSPYAGGIYHGRIVLPADYPMKPPNLILLTPNGRFETNKKICLSISGYHPETWLPSWSIRTALLALIGFMPTHSAGALGSLDCSREERRRLAIKSLDWRCATCGVLMREALPPPGSTGQGQTERLLSEIRGATGAKNKVFDKAATTPNHHDKNKLSTPPALSPILSSTSSNSSTSFSFPPAPPPLSSVLNSANNNNFTSIATTNDNNNNASLYNATPTTVPNLSPINAVSPSMSLNSSPSSLCSVPTRRCLPQSLSAGSSSFSTAAGTPTSSQRSLHQQNARRMAHGQSASPTSSSSLVLLLCIAFLFFILLALVFRRILLPSAGGPSSSAFGPSAGGHHHSL